MWVTQLEPGCGGNGALRDCLIVLRRGWRCWTSMGLNLSGTVVVDAFRRVMEVVHPTRIRPTVHRASRREEG